MNHFLPRRQFLQNASLTCAALATAPHSLYADDPAPSSKPNVLFIAIDDLRPQLGCYGHQQIHSPNIDRFAKSAMQFNRAYCNIPVCGASRCSLMSGLRPTADRFTSYRDRVDEETGGTQTLADYFKAARYHTLSWGKIYHNRQDDLDGWSEKPYLPRPDGLVGWQAYRSDKNQELFRARQAAGKQNAMPWEIHDGDDHDYPDGLLADQAIKKLADLKKSTKPFFFATGFWKPHLPFNAPKKYWDLYPENQIDLADNPFRPKGAPDRALHQWGELRGYAGIPAEGPVDEATARKLIRGYYACVSYTDAQVGKLLKALDDLKLSENTIVVLWGDHGWQLGEHGLWCKHANFETSLHTPLLIRAPGHAPGQTDAICELVDLFPTLAEMTGHRVPDFCEGQSLKPLLQNPQRRWKQAAFSMYAGGVSMKTDRYRYTAWPIADKPTQARMLYDHQTDPHENVNIAEDPQHAALVARLHQQLRAGWKPARA